MVKRRNKKYPRLLDITFNDGTTFNCVVPLSHILGSKIFTICYDGNEYYLYKNKLYNQKKERVYKMLVFGNKLIPVPTTYDSAEIFKKIFIKHNRTYKIINHRGFKSNYRLGEYYFVDFEKEWNVNLVKNDDMISINNKTTIEEYARFLNAELLNISTFIRRYNIC